MASLQTILIKIIKTFFDIYSSLILLRFLFQCSRIDFYNPLAQSIVKITNPLLVPLRKFIPGYGGIDLASIILLLSVGILENGLIYAIAGGGLPNLLSLIIIAISNVLSHASSIYTFAIIIISALSWFPMAYAHPVPALIEQLVEPLLKPIRRRIASFTEGLDFSPIVALLGLWLFKELFINRLFHLGLQLNGR